MQFILRCPGRLIEIYLVTIPVIRGFSWLCGTVEPFEGFFHLNWWNEFVKCWNGKVFVGWFVVVTRTIVAISRRRVLNSAAFRDWYMFGVHFGGFFFIKDYKHENIVYLDFKLKNPEIFDYTVWVLWVNPEPQHKIRSIRCTTLTNRYNKR